MEFLELFSLKDVAIVLTGLIIASIVRIYYDSLVTEKKAKQFGSSLGIYNSVIEDTREGLFIFSNNEVIYSNTEAADILNTKVHNINKEYLESTMIGLEDKDESMSLLDIIQTKSYVTNAHTAHGLEPMAISISINNFTHDSDGKMRVVVLQDMTNINELREGARILLDG